MNIVFEFAVFFGVCLLGEIVSAVLPFPFPGSVIAMVLLFIFLIVKAVKVDKIKKMSDFLLDNMTFFFIPPTVDIINYLGVIKNVWWQFILICCVTTFLTFCATAYTVKAVMHLINRKEKKND
ncbi:MAG: CidA/LrgA family protein [Clostridia bacterium]|nr:CidA/LrgA family protein [Clostridia bacterium]